MTTIGFIRHGVTAWNKEGRTQGGIDIPLDEDGIQMAKKVRDRLAAEDWAVIYTSPLQRAHMTAMLIAIKHPQLKVIADDRLREIGEGEIEGTTEEERIQKWGRSWRKFAFACEAEDKVIDRGLSFVEEINNKYPNQKVLVVSHGSFIKKMLQQLCPTASFKDEIGNTSVTIVTMGHENKCTLYNCMRHMEDKEKDCTHT